MLLLQAHSAVKALLSIPFERNIDGHMGRPGLSEPILRGFIQVMFVCGLGVSGLLSWMSLIVHCGHRCFCHCVYSESKEMVK